MNEQDNIRYESGHVSYLNNEKYANSTAYEALVNIKKEDRLFRTIFYITSPYSGDVYHNVEKARVYCRFAVEKMQYLLHRICYFLSSWMTRI